MSIGMAMIEASFGFNQISVKCCVGDAFEFGKPNFIGSAKKAKKPDKVEEF